MSERNQPRRVLMTADTVGGVWTYAMELAQGLGERGVEVSLATMGEPLSELQREKAGRILRLRVFESTFKLEWMDDPWRDVERAGDWLLGLEARIAPDLVHLNGFAHGDLAWGAPVLVAGHSCVLSWWAAVKGGTPPAAFARYRDTVAAGLTAADLVVAPSVAMLASLEKHYGPIGAPIGAIGARRRSRVIPNGRDARLFRPAAKEPMLFSAGRLWDEAKNLAGLERVAPRLPWPVYVAGENRHPGHPGYPETGEPRDHHARFLGQLSQRALAAWLGRSAIYVLPARYEPFGLSALEAALAGCALVLGDIPSLREVWGRRAVFVPPDDPAALERAVRRLIDDPEHRAAMAAAARARALEHTPERMVEGYLAAYAEILGPAERAARRADFPVRAAV